jgi:diguanylate cyclase (GGDEF)-like protein
MSAALECYLFSILEIAETIEAVSPDVASSFREPLLSLRSRVAANPNPTTLRQSMDALHDILDTFCEKARSQNEALARDINETLTMVARTEDAKRNVEYVERLVDFADRLESAILSGDLQRLATETSHLRGLAKSIETSSRDDFARLRERMIEVQHRLHDVELLATLDPLTGIPNRRDLERELSARINDRQEFCVLLFDLNGFKEINDRFGQLVGDQMLKQMAARLNNHVRSGDYLCRWGGDEFVAILACDLAVAELRANQIAVRLSSPCQIVGPEGEISVHIAVSVGLAQYCGVESPEQLFGRVDESMYRHKHSSAAG